MEYFKNKNCLRIFNIFMDIDFYYILINIDVNKKKYKIHFIIKYYHEYYTLNVLYLLFNIKFLNFL